MVCSHSAHGRETRECGNPMQPTLRCDLEYLDGCSRDRSLPAPVATIPCQVVKMGDARQYQSRRNLGPTDAMISGRPFARDVTARASG